MRNALVAQVADREVVGFGFAEFRIFEVDAAHPEAFVLEALDEVAADEPLGFQYQRFSVFIDPTLSPAFQTIMKWSGAGRAEAGVHCLTRRPMTTPNRSPASERDGLWPRARAPPLDT